MTFPNSASLIMIEEVCATFAHQWAGCHSQSLYSDQICIEIGDENKVLPKWNKYIAAHKSRAQQKRACPSRRHNRNAVATDTTSKMIRNNKKAHFYSGFITILFRRKNDVANKRGTVHEPYVIGWRRARITQRSLVSVDVAVPTRTKQLKSWFRVNCEMRLPLPCLVVSLTQ